MHVTFISGNKFKIQAMERWLGYKLPHQAIDQEEFQELDPYVVVVGKAKAAFAVVGTPVLVEDTSLKFTALGRLPGTLVKWFLEEIGVDGLCRLLKDFDDRTATVHIVMVVYDGKTMSTFEAKVQGTIADKPRGESFGWNPIFIPNGSHKTYAELDNAGDDVEYGKFNARNKAVQKLKPFLDNN